jgi:hypothetical protein
MHIKWPIFINLERFMKNFLSLVLTLSFFLTNGISQIRKYSNEFLAIGVGARALGMSNAVVGSVRDVTSGYWNPGGLNHLNNDLQVGLMHANYFANLAKYDYIGLAKRIDSSSVGGFSMVRFGVDDIPNTTELIDNQGNIDYNRITTFSAADYAFIFYYARDLGIKGLYVGANAKIIRRKVGDFAGAWGFGLDAGAQYEKGPWNFGLMLRDVTSTFNAWKFNLDDRMKEVFVQTGNEIPVNSLEITMPRMIAGVSRWWELGKKFSLRGAADFDFTFDGKRNVLIKSSVVSIDPHFGVEAGYRDIIFLRGGIGNIQKETDFRGGTITTLQPNMGVGLKIKQVALDYGLTDIGDVSAALYSHIFSLRFDINKQPKP